MLFHLLSSVMEDSAYSRLAGQRIPVLQDHKIQRPDSHHVLKNIFLLLKVIKEGHFRDTTLLSNRLNLQISEIRRFREPIHRSKDIQPGLRLVDDSLSKISH